MKSGIHYPYERNKYFFGKLLTVADFETEQRYFNDKRRLINRVLNGCGIVCGLSVVMVDNDREISIEKGMALDYCGREIIVDAPLRKTLPMIDGFDSDRQGDCYLCLEYNETEAEPVHSIVGTSAHDGNEAPKNKYRETYRLSITYEEGDSGLLHGYDLYQDRQIVFQNEDMRIVQTCPKFVNSGQEFMLEIEVKFFRDLPEPVRFSYTLTSNCLKDGQGSRDILISFDERDYAKATLYHKAYAAKATAVNEVRDSLRVAPESFALYIGESLQQASADFANSLEILEGDIKERVHQKYYEWPMDNAVQASDQHRIYLARIRYIGAGSTYSIREIENAPYRQYVPNPVLSDIDNLLEKQKWQRLALGQGLAQRELTRKLEGLVERNNSIINAAGLFATGVEEVDFGLNGRKNQRYFSNEVIHGLGAGCVHIVTGVLTEDDKGLGKGYAVYGDQSIFKDVEFAGDLPQMTIGVLTDFDNGTFRIGVRLEAGTEWSRVKICWFAYKAGGNQAEYLNLNRNILKIKPDLLRLTYREIFKYETEGLSIPASDLLWSVVEEQGGVIDENGIYTAPDLEGIYQIKVSDRRNPEVEANAFVIVKEAEK